MKYSNSEKISDNYLTKRKDEISQEIKKVIKNFPCENKPNDFNDRLDKADSISDNYERLKELVTIEKEFLEYKRSSLKEKYFSNKQILTSNFGYYEQEGKYGIVNLSEGKASANVFDNVGCIDITLQEKVIVGQIGLKRYALWCDNKFQIEHYKRIKEYVWAVEFFPLSDYYEEKAEKYFPYRHNNEIFCLVDSRKFPYEYNNEIFSSTVFRKLDYDDIYCFHNGFTRVKRENRVGFININEVEICQLKYFWAKDFEQGYAPVQDNNDNWGFINENGKEICKLKYLEVKDFHEGYAAVKGNNGNWGFINQHGKEICKLKYLKVKDFHEGYAAVQGNNGKWGFINQHGKEICKLKYFKVCDFHEGYAEVVRLSDVPVTTAFFEKYAEPVRTGGNFDTAKYFDCYIDVDGGECLYG